MRKLVLFVFVFSLFLVFPGKGLAATRSEPLIVDHRAVMEFDNIPESYINTAKSQFKMSYGHTSHGSQIVAGMSLLATNAWGDSSLYGYTPAFLCDRCIPGASDLGNPNRSAWATATRNYLNDSGSDKNMIIWSWCGQHNTSEENIDLYLSLMNDLEVDFPEVAFVYMTGHLNGDGPGGNTRVRNDQIRNYCIANNKILFDFADIERHDPNGVDYPNGSDDCGWCSSWCSSHSCPSCSCSHSHCFNCYQKGKAFWWMMAKLAGWETSCVTGDSNNDGDINIADLEFILSRYSNDTLEDCADQNGDGVMNSFDFGEMVELIQE